MQEHERQDDTKILSEKYKRILCYYKRQTHTSKDTSLLRVLPTSRQMSGILYRNTEGLSNANSAY